MRVLNTVSQKKKKKTNAMSSIIGGSQIDQLINECRKLPHNSRLCTISNDLYHCLGPEINRFGLNDKTSSKQNK